MLIKKIAEEIKDSLDEILKALPLEKTSISLQIPKIHYQGITLEGTKVVISRDKAEKIYRGPTTG